MIMIDDAILPFRGAKYCHLMSDQPGQAGLDELHAFAARLGLRRSWFQDKTRWPHYDVVIGWRDRAVKLGAQLVTSKELVERNPNRTLPAAA